MKRAKRAATAGDDFWLRVNTVSTSYVFMCNEVIMMRNKNIV